MNLELKEALKISLKLNKQQ